MRVIDAPFVSCDVLNSNLDSEGPALVFAAMASTGSGVAGGLY
jgi:hypothetical protein